MKKYILLLFHSISVSLFSQQGIIESNFGLGEYNYVDNYLKEAPISLDYTNNSLYIAGYSNSITNISNEGNGTALKFPSKDAFYYYTTNFNDVLARKAVSVGNNGSRANAIKYYKDKVVLAGYSFDDNNKSIALVRLNASTASIDSETEFSTDGKVVTDFTSDDIANAIDIKDDKIIIGGRAGKKAVIVKYYFNNGRIDKDFNQKGFTFLELGQKTEIKNLNILSDNKILVSGYTFDGVQEDFFAARFNPDGTLDSSFGNNGIKIIDFFGKNDRPNAMKILSDGKILLAGFCDTNTNSKIDAAVVKLTSNGSLDTSFSGTGKKVINFGTQEDVINHINTNSLDEIILLGYKTSGNYKNSVIDSYNKNGGTASTQQNTVVNQSYYDDYLVAGYFNNSTKISPIGVGFCRENKAFLLRENFETLVYNSSCGQEYNSQPDKKIRKIISQDDGKFYILNSQGLYRYLPTGLIDKTFANNGFFNDIPVGDFDILENKQLAIVGYESLIDESGKIQGNYRYKKFENIYQHNTNSFKFNQNNKKLYASASVDFTNDSETTKPILYRYNADGSIDYSFAQNKGYIDVPSQYSIYAPDAERLYVGANSIATVYIDNNLHKLSIYLYDLDGKPVSSFGNNGVFQKDYTPDYYETLKKIVIDTSNNVYLISEKSTDFNYRILSEKILSNGTPDLSYGNNGVFVYGTQSPNNLKFSTIAVQPDNKLLIVGKSSEIHGFILRLNLNGTLDNSFGIKNNGVVSDYLDNNPNDFFEEITAINLTSDNKILVGGNNQEGSVATDMTNNKIKKFK